MLETAYIVTWRWSDGSGSGATAAFVDKKRADRLLEVLSAEPCGKVYAIEAVPFDSTAGVPAVQKRLPLPGLDDRAAEWDAWHEEYKRTHGYGPGIGDAWDAAYRAAWKRATCGVEGRTK